MEVGAVSMGRRDPKTTFPIIGSNESSLVFCHIMKLPLIISSIVIIRYGYTVKSYRSTKTEKISTRKIKIHALTEYAILERDKGMISNESHVAPTLMFY